MWLNSARDTQLARVAAGRMLAWGRRLECVWSGVRLDREALDIDHCLPWSAWPCDDLWNLMPASRRVNQRLKRDRLPWAAALSTRRSAIVPWWDEAWRSDAALAERFAREATATLPVGSHATGEEVFSALEWRRLRLRQDQGLQEWPGAAL